MPDKLYACFELIKSILLAFRDTDFSQVSYESPGLAFGAGLFLLVVFLYKVLWGRNKFRHYGSGHKIPAEFDESTLFRRLVYVFPKAILVAFVIFTLIVLANPYLPRTKIEKIVESRERIELLDVSSSKGWEFDNTGKSAGEIARQAHLKFLKLRRGQNDRVALWLFSQNAYKVEDFITDDDVYMMKVKNAPYVMVQKAHPALPENDSSNYYCDIVAPRNQVEIVEGEGATNLIVGLQAVIKYFDQESKRNVKGKSSLLIETDAAIEADPESEFKELKKRKIIPYIIFIKPNMMCENQFGRPDPVGVSEALKNRIRQYGGKVFDVEDRRSAERAYAEINKLETSPSKIVRHQFKVFIFQRPLAVAVMLALLSILFGTLFERLFGTYP